MEKKWINPFDRFRTSWLFIGFLFLLFSVITYQIVMILNEPNNPSAFKPYVLKSNQESNENINPPNVVKELKDNSSVLPDDLNEKSCGYYYEEYGICSGKCNKGYCEFDNNRCYCNKE
jgi:hypothetical protein